MLPDLYQEYRFHVEQACYNVVFEVLYLPLFIVGPVHARGHQLLIGLPCLDLLFYR